MYTFFAACFFISLFACFRAQAQVKEPCLSILDEARRLYRVNKLQEALKKINDLETCDYNHRLTAKRQALQKLVFNAIEQLNRNLKIEKNNAVKQALENKKIADELNKANASINSTAERLLIQVDSNKRLVVNNYLNNSQKAIAEKNTLEAILFTAEALSINTDTNLLKTSLVDIDNYLPETYLANILIQDARISNAMFSPEGNRILTINDDNTTGIWDANTGNRIGNFIKHDGSVLSAVFSPDGNKILTANADKTVRIWDLSTGKQSGPSLKHDSIVLSGVFSPDGTRILTASRDGTARIWDAETGKLAGPLITHKGIVKSNFSPDGKWILTTSGIYTHDGNCRLWDAATGRQWSSIKNINDAVFSPDGKWILTISLSMPARLWNARTKKQIKINEKSTVRNAVFSPDATQVLTIYGDTAKIWDAGITNQLGKSMIQDGGIGTAVFSLDGKFILTVSRIKTARLWDAATGKQRYSMISVNSADFSPNGRLMLNLSIDGKVRIYSVVSTKQIEQSMLHDGGVSSAVFSPDEKWILTTSEVKRVRTSWLWDAATGDQKFSIKVFKDPVFSPDGKYILTINRDSSAQLWDISTGKHAVPAMKHEGFVYEAVFSPDGQRILTTSGDSTARLWDAATGKQAGHVMKHNGAVGKVIFSPDRKRLLTASWDSTTRLWDAATRMQLAPPMKYKHYVSLTAFSPEGKHILTACDDTVWLWDAETGKQVGPLMKHNGRVSNAFFSPDGMRVLTTSWDNTARIWDAGTGNQIGASMLHYTGIYGTAFSPDGMRILTTSGDGTARFWDSGTGKQIGQAIKYGGKFPYRTNAVFSSDGKWILLNWDSTARLWDAGTGKQIGPAMRHEGNVTSAVFSPDGKQILTASSDKTARLWNIRGDLDIPPDLFKLQIMATTGCELDVATGETKLIPREEWYTIKAGYAARAREHYKMCKYREYNAWRHFYPQEAEEIDSGK